MKSFRARVGLVFGLALAGVVTAGIWLYRAQRREAQANVRAALESVFQAKARQIATWRSELITDASGLVDNPFLEAAVAGWQSSPQPASASALVDYLRSVATHHRYRKVRLVDPAGQVLLSSAALEDPLHSGLAPAIATAIRAQRVMLTDLNAPSAAGPAHLDVIAPLRLRDSGPGRALGALVLQVDANDYLYPVVRSWPVPSASAETTFVRREGNEVLYLGELREQADAPFKLRVPLSQRQVPAVQAVLGTNGFVRGTDYAGTEVVTVLGAIPDSPWYLVAKVSAAEAYASLRQRAWSTGTIVGLLVLALGLGWCWVLAEEKFRLAHQEALRASEENLSVTLNSIGDGVLATDAEGRVTRLNPVAEQLTGWSQADAMGRSVAEVFRVVQEPTREPAAVPITEALKTGRIVHLANHALLIARDGTERPVADSAAPIRDRQNRMIGAVLVFRDMTEDYLKQRRLRDRETLLTSINTHLAGSLICRFHLPVQGGVKFTYVSPNLGALLEVDLERFLANPERIRAQVLPEDQPILQAAWQRATESSDDSEFTIRLRRSDGRVRWLHIRGRHIERLPDGTQVRDAVVTDITSLKEAEAEVHRLNENLELIVAARVTALGESAAQLREAQRVGRMGSWQLDLLTNRLVWSEEIFRLFEIDAQKFPETYEAFLAAVHPEDRDLVHQAYTESVQRRAPYEIVHRLQMPDGRIKYVQERGETRYDDAGRPLSSFGTVLDISERRQAELALQESLRLLQSVVEHAPTRVFWKDSGLRYLGCNSLFAEDAGYSTPAEVIGKTDFEMAWKNQAELYRADDLAVIESGVTKLGYEEPQTTPDGRRVWLRTSKVPLHGAGNRVVGVLGIYEDITDRKNLEAQLRQAQKLEAIGQLAGGVAHDFNNILAATMMHLGLLKLNPDLDAETQQGLKDLETQTRRAASLTNQLLMFSRRSVLALRPVEVNDVVANLLKMLNRVIGEQVDLRFDGGKALPLVEADTGMLEQVLMNLVVNARDAMPHGGRVTIATSAIEFTAPETAANQARRPGRFVSLTVSDTGCGMDEETQRRIFEPFFTTKEVGKGTGLGLATVHGIAAQHSGWIEVESAPGRGSTFRVYLPALEKPSEAAAPEAVERPLVRGGGERILLVEDDAEVRSMTRRTLVALGYRVEEAANGREAMRLWQTHQAEVNVLLTDMVMPEGMTGLDLAKRLQAEKPSLSVIICSGYSSEIVQAGVPSEEGIVYLPKPFATKAIADVVRKCLERVTKT